ncbi:MAG TPA: hypothetical protein VFF05_05885, partial [Rudaea sp.]|nr:hypothetical protein [Rudaea sp.]
MDAQITLAFRQRQRSGLNRLDPLWSNARAWRWPVRTRRRWWTWIAAWLSLAAAPVGAEVPYAALAKFWTPDALHVPYRAMQTPGRLDGEKLPLIVFLHGDWQDGTNNESQLAGYGNGSMLWLDQANHGD